MSRAPRPGGLCAELHKAVPQPGSVLAAAVNFKAERLARVARLGHADQTALERDGAERVLHRLGELHARPESVMRMSLHFGPCTAMAAQSFVISVMVQL